MNNPNDKCNSSHACTKQTAYLVGVLMFKTFVLDGKERCCFCKADLTSIKMAFAFELIPDCRVDPLDLIR